MLVDGYLFAVLLEPILARSAKATALRANNRFQLL